MATGAAVRDIRAVLGCRGDGRGRARARAMVDVLGGQQGQLAQRIHHAAQGPDLETAGVVAGGGQGLDVGNERGRVFIAHAREFGAGHEHHRMAVGLDAMADRRGDLVCVVGLEYAARRDVGRHHLEHGAGVEHDSPLAIRGVAVGAAARCKQMSAALDGRGIAAHRQRRVVDDIAAFQAGFGLEPAKGEHRHRHDQQHASDANHPFQEFAHVPLSR